MHRRFFLIGVLLVGTLCVATKPVLAQQDSLQIKSSEIESNQQENRLVQAWRLSTPLTIDGRLDEEVYTSRPSATGFIQQEPKEGLPATEETEIWVFFDSENFYFSARCWDSQPERMVANEMLRDGNIVQNDNITLTLDTFNDDRTGFYFQTNPVGGLRDQQINTERNANVNWNTVWDVKTTRDERGWSVEMVVPFKSLRYPSSGEQLWGINVRRIVRWKNERSFLSPVPASYGSPGVFAVSLGAPLVGLEVPAAKAQLEFKPYAKFGVASDYLVQPVVSNDWTADGGLDFKYGLTKGLVADVTINTDFAQVEADAQQVNLTRASLYFPEKRDFFLEGQGIFSFGGASTYGGYFGLRPVLENGSATSLIPSLFFSRRIGIGNGYEVPIRAGGRIAGLAGPFAIGVLNIQTGDSQVAGVAPTNFSVVRIRRNILRRSTIGMMVTSRSRRSDGEGSSQAFGVDANLTFFETLTILSYYAKTRTPEIVKDNDSYLVKVNFPLDKYGFNFERLSVGEGFKPDMGLLMRTGFKRTYGYARYSPRPQAGPIRKITWRASLDYITDRQNQLQSREALAGVRLDFNNSDQWVTEYRRNFEFLAEPFKIARDVFIAPGVYKFQDIHLMYFSGSARKLSGRFSMNYGSFYGGTRTEAAISSKLDLGPQLGIEPRISFNWIKLPNRSFRTDLIGGRVIFAMTPRMVLSSLTQYNSDARVLTSNVRFRWEYIPGSDLFVVYTDGRNTSMSGFPILENRSFAVKFTRLFRR